MRFFRNLLLAGLLVTVTVASGVVLFLQHNQQSIAAHVADELALQLGWQCSLGAVQVVFFPMPSLSITDTRLENNETTLHIAQIGIRPALMPLLQGTFSSSTITLVRPQLTLTPQSPTTDMASFWDNIREALQLAAIPEHFNNTRIEIAEASIHPDPHNAYRIAIEALHASLHIEADGVFSIKMTTQGDIIHEEVSIPFQLTSTVTTHNATYVQLTATHLTLDKDSLTVTGTLDMQEKDSPTFQGTIALKRLSLPQWFGFARQLPPGLQNTLDTLTGSLDVHINTTGLQVTNIHVAAADGMFTGKGSVAQWDTPIIFLDLKAPHLTLHKGFPEAEGAYPAAPTFFHEPLTPVPGTEAAKAMPGPDINYDIQLQVDKLDAWQLALGNVSFTCIPADNGNVRMNGLIRNIYGGRAEGTLILRPEGAQNARGDILPTRYTIKGNFRNIQAERMLARWGTPWLGGRLSATCDVQGQGKDMASFLTSLQGSTSITIVNGFTQAERGSREKQPFQRLSLTTNAKAASVRIENNTIPAELIYHGQWKFDLQTPQGSVAFNADGPLVFSGKSLLPVQLRKASGHLALNIAKDVLQIPQAIQTHISGIFSLDTEKWQARVDNAHAQIFGTKMQGNVQATFEPTGMNLQGKVSAETKNARNAVHALAPHMLDGFPANAFGKAALQTTFAINAKEMRFSELLLHMDTATIRGNVHRFAHERPLWKLHININSLPFDTYFPPSPKQQKASKTTKQPWDLTWLRANDMEGDIYIDTVNIRRNNLHAVHIPLRLRQSHIDCTPTTAQIYDGTAQLAFQATARQDLHIQTAVQARKINLHTLSKEKFPLTALWGETSFTAKLQGTVRSAVDVLTSLQGEWNIRMDNCAFQERTAQGSLKGNPTHIGTIHAQGTLHKGIVRSPALSITGNDIRAKGDGWINIDNNTLDVQLAVSTQRLNNIPVRYYGNLNKPERSVSTGSIIWGTLSTIGTGTLDTIGFIFGGIFRIFQ